MALSFLSDPCPLGLSDGPTGSLGRHFASGVLEEEITICFNLLVNCFPNRFFSMSQTLFCVYYTEFMALH